MGFMDGISRQLRSVIEWSNPMENELFYRWSENGDEIKNASKLIIGPAQGAIFVYEGKVVADIQEEGIVSLTTDNIPFVTTLMKVMQSFESEHKVGIYFYKRSTITNQKWGTTTAIKYQDPVYDFPVSLRAFGNYSFKIIDAKHFFTSIVGTRDYYLVSDLRALLSDRILNPLSDYLAEQKYAYIDIDANRDEIARDLLEKLSNTFNKLGFKLSDFQIEGNEFDEDTLSRINAIADVSADIMAAKNAGISYKELQQLQALKDAANNESGGAGMMMGFASAQALSPHMSEAATPTSSSVKSRLIELKSLFDEGLITEAEYSDKKAVILLEL